MLMCGVSILNKYGKLAFDSELMPLCLKWQEMAVMTVPERMPGGDQILLSQFLKTGKGDVTRLIGQMQRKGFLLLQIPNGDRRRRENRLTLQGKPAFCRCVKPCQVVRPPV